VSGIRVDRDEQKATRPAIELNGAMDVAGGDGLRMRHAGRLEPVYHSCGVGACGDPLAVVEVPVGAVGHEPGHMLAGRILATQPAMHGRPQRVTVRPVERLPVLGHVLGPLAGREVQEVRAAHEAHLVLVQLELLGEAVGAQRGEHRTLVCHSCGQPDVVVADEEFDVSLGVVLARRLQHLVHGPIYLILHRHGEVSRKLAVSAEAGEVHQVAVDADGVRLVVAIDVVPHPQRKRVAEVRVEVTADLHGDGLLADLELAVGAMPGAHALVRVVGQVLRPCGLRHVPQDRLRRECRLEPCLPLELCPESENKVHQAGAVVAHLPVAVSAGGGPQQLAGDGGHPLQVRDQALFDPICQRGVLADVVEQGLVEVALLTRLLHQLGDVALLLRLLLRSTLARFLLHDRTSITHMWARGAMASARNLHSRFAFGTMIVSGP